jgi:pimeloyl-ACP methyl ester carboxylesterase
MTSTATAAALLALAPVVGLPTAVWQVAPEVIGRFEDEPPELKVTRDRAAVLIHGLQLHPIRPSKSSRPELYDWVQSRGDLVRALAADFDVFAFGYAQTVPVDAVSLSPGLAAGIEKLRQAGYADIVLIGHSAGGLIARQFVERFPEAGVTKVIQVATPNTGSDLAAIRVGLPKPQIPFIQSLAPRPRLEAARQAEQRIADTIEFCCVVCKVPRLAGDTLVGLESQWPPDLQRQGVPATLIAVSHFDAMKAPHAVERIAELAREKLIRWTPEQIEQGRQIVFSKDADAAALKRPPGRLFRPKPGP